MADDNLITIEVDGRAVEARKGQMIIEVTDNTEVRVPRFCYHKKLSVAANCRMCLVEVEKMPKPVPACATPVMDGMKVFTKSELAIEAQRGVMEFLLINHPLDCPICDQGGECELQDMAMGYGNSVSRYTESKRVVADEDIGPLVSTDMTRCIHCTRCVRFGDEVAGMRELGLTGRGENVRIGTYVKNAMASELSGNVIDLCPVGALNNKPYRFSARAWEMVQHAAISPHDCVGSNLYLHTLRGEVKRVVPKDNEFVNESWLADRDRYSCEALNAEERITRPQIKRDGQWYTVDWDDALQKVSEILSQETQQESPSIAGLISSSATIEEYYLMQKVIRGLGSNHIDHRTRQADFSDDEFAPMMPWLGMDLLELEKLDSALLIASNVRKDQPLLAHRLRKAALQGASIMFANQRHYEFHFPVSEQLVASPQNMIQALSGIVATLQTITGKTSSYAIQAALSDINVSEQHKAIAQNLLQANNSVVFIGSQAMLHPQYSAIKVLSAAIAELSAARIAYLSDGANAAGAWLAGAVPHRGPAGVALAKPGLNARQMLVKPLRNYVLFNIEIENESWDPSVALETLQQAGHVIAISAFASELLREYAEVILPLAAFSETSGTYVNAEGRWQSFAAAVEPKGEARPGWKILRKLGDELNLPGFDYYSIEAIRKDVQGLCNDIVLDNNISTQSVLSIETIFEDSDLLRMSEITIYSSDALVRRASDLQKTADGISAQAAMLNPITAERFGLINAAMVNVQYGFNTVALPLQINADIPDGYINIAMGVKGSEKLGPVYGAIEVDISNVS